MYQLEDQQVEKTITFGENMPTHRPSPNSSKAQMTNVSPIHILRSQLLVQFQFLHQISQISHQVSTSKCWVNFILPSGKSIFCHLRTVVITLWVGNLFDHKNSTRNPRWLTTPYRQKYANHGKRIIKNPPKGSILASTFLAATSSSFTWRKSLTSACHSTRTPTGWWWTILVCLWK